MKKLGLALSGGAVRGVFHLGVLRALDELSLPIHIISGTSSGAIVGALYRDGKSPEQIMDVVRSASILKMVRPKIWKQGLFSLNYLRELLKANLISQTIEELPSKLLITATNLNTARLDVFSTGPLVESVVASSSVPVMFEPITLGQYLYTDGGLLMNLPAAPLLGRCDVIIGVNLVPLTPLEDLTSFPRLAGRIFDISVSRNIQSQLALCDFVISSDEMQSHGRFSFEGIERLYDLGYKATMDQSKDIQERMKDA